MSNLPPNPFATGPPQVNTSQAFSQVPSNQLPPGYKQDANSNNPLPPLFAPQNNITSQVNNYHHSANSSPAFNQPGMMQPSLQSSPMRPIKPTFPPNSNQNPLLPPVPLASSSPRVSSANASPTPYSSNFKPPTPSSQQQINDNATPLVPSSHSQPLMNGPPISGSGPLTSQQQPQYPVNSAFGPPSGNFPPVSAFGPAQGTINNSLPPSMIPNLPKPPVTGPASQPNPPFSAAASIYSTNQGLPPNPHQINANLPPTQRFSSNMSAPLTGPPVSGPQSSVPPLLRPVGINGPSMSGPGPAMPMTSMGPQRPGLPPVSHSGLSSGPITTQPPYSGVYNNGPPSSVGPPLQPPPSGPVNHQMRPTVPPMSSSGPTMGLSGPQMTPPKLPMGTPGYTPQPGPPRPQMGPPRPQMGPQAPPGPNMGPPLSNMGPPLSQMGPPVSQMGPPVSQMGPPVSQMGPPVSQMGPPVSQMGPGPQMPTPRPPGSEQQMGPPSNMQGPPSNMQGPPSNMQGPPSNMQGPPSNMQGPPSNMPGPPSNIPGPPSNMPGPPTGQTKSNVRYPMMPQSYNQMPPQPNLSGPNAKQYNTQGLAQQMGQLSVTKQGFDQLWGHHMVDLMTCRNIVPEYPDDPPEIKLTHQFADSPNCSPDIFRCTINKIPETNNLLQKSRLPLGILIHPFKDLNHLPVIQCTTIVRCRACRTYINPFVFFVDSKRWKCNLCYRVNDLPEEFQYDPVSKSYGDPSRRPEVKSPTIEFIAPGEYMLRPPQPAVYLFVFDVSQIARESGYLQVACDTLKNNLDQLPGDARTQIGFICFDSHIHFYLMSDGLTRPKEMTVLDIDDVFLPSPESLLVNVGERRELVRELLTSLPKRHSSIGSPAVALGAALQAASKLLAPTGGRITVFQTCLPNVGPGALQPREDPNARSSDEVAHLNPATDFYKLLALDCSGAQIAVDLFLLNSQYSDLATLSGISKFSGGSVYHIPLYKSRPHEIDQFCRMFTRYLTRKIGFEAVMRVRCTRGISIHTFHGNFFVRSTDLLSLPNVSPDAGFGMQLTIDDALTDLQHVCFQAALLYTSSKGERRIRVHTMALPIASNLTEVLHSADQQCIIGLLCKMAVDRAQRASLGEAREALMNVAVEALSAHRLAQNLPAGGLSAALHAPASLALLPLYIAATTRTKAFRTGRSTRLDDRVAAMCDMKTLPLNQLLKVIYPDLYPIHCLEEFVHEDCDAPEPPRLQLTAERINMDGAYLLDDGETMIIYVCRKVNVAFLSGCLGVSAFNQLPDEMRQLPANFDPPSPLQAFIDKLNDDRPYASNILILRENSPNRHMFIERLVDDRMESAFSYYEFLQHIKVQVK